MPANQVKASPTGGVSHEVGHEAEHQMEERIWRCQVQVSRSLRSGSTMRIMAWMVAHTDGGERRNPSERGSVRTQGPSLFL